MSKAPLACHFAISTLAGGLGLIHPHIVTIR